MGVAVVLELVRVVVGALLPFINKDREKVTTLGTAGTAGTAARIHDNQVELNNERW